MTTQPKIVYQMSEFGVAVPVKEDDPAYTNRLFVYGILLSPLAAVIIKYFFDGGFSTPIGG